LDKISDFQRFHRHFRSLYENLNFWSKLALIFSVEKVFTNIKSHQRKVKNEIKINANLDQKFKFSHKDLK
jgi:TctA family transporter